MGFLEPRRPDLARARQCVAGCDSPQRAWQLLVDAGLLPADWLDDPRRRFVHDPAPRPTRDPQFAPHDTHPDRVDCCALIAADVLAVRAAEHAARELADALAPWGAPAFDHVRWWFIPRERYQYASTDTRPGAHYGLVFAFNALHQQLPDRVPRSMFGHAAACSDAWRAAAKLRAGSHPSRALVGRTFGDLPDPFAALARIEEAGYATREWIATTGAVILVAPE